MKKSASILLLGLLLSAPALAGAGAPSKSIEVRRFDFAPGVVYPPEFRDFLYTQLIQALEDSRQFAAILGENELPSAAEAESLVLEGTMQAARGAWYRGAGEKKLSAEIVLRRRSGEIIFKKQITASPSVWTRISYEDENELWSAAALANRIVKEVRGAIKP